MLLNNASNFTMSAASKCIEFDSRLKHPFGALVAGPTQSGKTNFIIRLLQCASEVIFPRPERLIWCFGCYQEAFRNLEHVEFFEGLPSNFESLLNGKPTLIVIDDLMSESDERVSKLFTKYSHHKNASIIYVSQNLFHRGRENRNISLNAHYLVLFKNPRDSMQIAALGRQIFPGKGKYLQEAYADATAKPYGYLFIDLKPTTPDELRLRTGVLVGEVPFAYIYK
jgi:hypothetical protein